MGRLHRNELLIDFILDKSRIQYHAPLPLSTGVHWCGLLSTILYCAWRCVVLADQSISVFSCQQRQPALIVSNRMLSSRTSSVLTDPSHHRDTRDNSNNMRLISACLALLLGIVTARKEILKRQGDYYLRLHNQGGNLVLDEGIYMITLTPPYPVFVGDVIQREMPLKAPNMYIR